LANIFVFATTRSGARFTENETELIYAPRPTEVDAQYTPSTEVSKVPTPAPTTNCVPDHIAELMEVNPAVIEEVQLIPSSE
jgi:hypothetical protein